MEPLGILLFFAFLFLVIGLPIWAAVSARSTRRALADFEARSLEAQQRAQERHDLLAKRIRELEHRNPVPPVPESPPLPLPMPVPLTVVKPEPAGVEDLKEEELHDPVRAASQAMQETPAPAREAAPELPSSAPPPLPALETGMPASVPPLPPSLPPLQKFANAPAPATPPAPVPAAAPKAPPISLEQFMGVKLFAWVGGLALFLGVVFFIKYAFDNNLIPPSVRVATGFLIGAVLTGAGLKLSSQPRYTVLAHTLCATGVLVLYGVTFAAHALYRFPVFTTPATFALMALITAGAFGLALRLNAPVVAVLGMVGGFLTPLLLSSGQDQPVGLFGYITLLNAGLLGVAKYRNWRYLTLLGALGTVLMQYAWAARFFESGNYDSGAKTWIVVAVFAGFALFFTAGAWWTRRRAEGGLFPGAAALIMGGSALLAAFILLDVSAVALRPGVLYTLVLLTNAAVLINVWAEPRLRPALAAVGGLTFVHLGLWTAFHLASELLPAALVIYLVFGAMHTAFAVLWQRTHPQTSQSIAGYLPVAVLLLMFLPVLRLPEVSMIVWPAILLVNLLVIGLAFSTRALLPVLSALVLTLFTTGFWLVKLPPVAESLPGFLIVVCGFAVLFAAAASYLSARTQREDPDSALAPWLPVSAAVLPFVLLVMATVQLPLPSPSPVFGAALGFVLFLLALARFTSLPGLTMAALGCVLVLEITWQVLNFRPAAPWTPLLWYLGFYALFTAFPFMFRKAFESTTWPWAAAAAVGPGTYLVVQQVVHRTWPNDFMGLLPAAFAVLPLLSLAAVAKLHAKDSPARLSQMAWFGGVALFFITLIFPVQFERQWITLGWAFEGAALCWLYLRVPHNGLRITGTVLLVAAFVRLALNPAVLTYQTRGETAILNWYLYAYGAAAAALFLAARWLMPPSHRLGEVNLRALFCSLGGILLFLLVNIQIADAFTVPGARFIAFEFQGNFARDMTYSIAWGFFALSLLGLGFWLRTAATRYAGIGLLAVTLLKLFFHDLANIGSIYRIGALIIVALTALTASFLYQRFLDGSRAEKE